jgi:hypothetical protein
MWETWRIATFHWQAIMGQAFICIFALVISKRAMAFIIIHQILTTTGCTSTVRAIRDVLAPLDFPLLNCLCESTIAFAVEIILMSASGFLVVSTLSIG